MIFSRRHASPYILYQTRKLLMYPQILPVHWNKYSVHTMLKCFKMSIFLEFNISILS